MIVNRVFGVDASNWQSAEKFKDMLSKDNVAFAFIKVSEGATWRDSSAGDKVKACMEKGVNIGFYHYCRPDLKNSVDAEVTNFMASVDGLLYGYGYTDTVALALDVEDKSLQYLDWVNRFITAIKRRYGVNIIVYCSRSVVPSIGAFVDTKNVGLWVADWSDKHLRPEDIKPWSVYAFRQYTNNPYDKDYFNGKYSQMVEYFTYGKNKMIYDTTCGCKCHCCSGK